MIKYRRGFSSVEVSIDRDDCLVDVFYGVVQHHPLVRVGCHILVETIEVKTCYV